MLQQIDTAIAFTVVMLMLSLIVMAIVQMVSALSDLRGRNLASGLENLLRQIEPEFRKQLREVTLEMRKSTTDSPGPPIQESKNAQQTQNQGSPITQQTQSALPGPQDKKPASAQHAYDQSLTLARHIAEIVVRHPAIAHAGTRAKAVSQSDLVRVLRDLCSDEPAAILDPAAKMKLKNLLNARVPGGIYKTAQVQDAAQRLVTALPGQETQVKAAVDAAFSTVSKLEHQVSQWFNTVMDRLSDIFARKARIITVVVSVLLVTVLQIDSGHILRQIVHSPELRAKLTEMSENELAQADKLFDNGERAAAALADLKQKHASDDAKTVAALAQVPSHLTRCVDGRNALIDNTQKVPNAEALLKEFDDACQDKTRQAMGNAYDEMRGLRADLEKTNLNIIPATVLNSRADWWNAYREPHHLLGVLVSVLLLSLGAPFWFNALRQLSNLKPAIAEKVDAAKQAAQTQPNDGKSQ